MSMSHMHAISPRFSPRAAKRAATGQAHAAVDCQCHESPDGSGVPDSGIPAATKRSLMKTPPTTWMVQHLNLLEIHIKKGRQDTPGTSVKGCCADSGLDSRCLWQEPSPVHHWLSLRDARPTGRPAVPRIGKPRHPRRTGDPGDWRSRAKIPDPGDSDPSEKGLKS